MARIQKLALGLAQGTADELLGAVRQVLGAAGWRPDLEGASRLRVSVAEVPGSGLLLDLDVGDHDGGPFARQVARLTGHRVRLHHVTVDAEPAEGDEVGFAWAYTSTDVEPDGVVRPGPDASHADLDLPFGGDPSETADAALWMSAVAVMPADATLVTTMDWGHPSPHAALHPDPWTFAPPPVACVELECGANAASLSAEASRYLAWRLDMAEAIDRASVAPDLETWTVRLLRRHELEGVPSRDDPSAAAFWADVMERTTPERSRISENVGRIPAWKFEVEGAWILSEYECSVILRVLDVDPVGHEPSVEQAQVIERLRALLRGADGCVARVRDLS